MVHLALLIAAALLAHRRVRGLGRRHMLDPVMFLDDLWIDEDAS